MAVTVSSLQCLVCERQVEDALTICGAAVCTECEKHLVGAHPWDPEYDRLVERFRTFWEGLAEAAASLD